MKIAIPIDYEIVCENSVDGELPTMELLEEWWNSPLAHEHYIYLRTKENGLPEFRFRSPQISARRFVVDWVAEVCDKLTLCLPARHLAVSLYDYFLDGYTVKDKHLKLVALSALRIAAKFEEIELKIPRTMELNDPSKGVIFTDSEYLQMELIILNVFNWNVGFPTAAHFMDYLSVDAVTQTDLCNNAFLSRMSLDSAKKIVEKYITYFLEISLQEYNFRSIKPSLVCAASIVAARTCLNMTPVWTDQLQKRTGYVIQHMNFIVSIMISIFKKDEERSAQRNMTSCMIIQSPTYNMPLTPQISPSVHLQVSPAVHAELSSTHLVCPQPSQSASFVMLAPPSSMLAPPSMCRSQEPEIETPGSFVGQLEC